jgi:hypothetical protein
MNTKQMKKFMAKLRVTNDSVIMILSKGEDDLDAKQLAASLGEAVKQMDLKNIVVLLIDDFDRITTIDLRTMNKFGWFRREQIELLFHKISRDKIQVPESEKEDD